MKNTTRFAAGRRFEVASIGRLAVDLYANQYGCDLEEVSTFAKYLGGSSGNVAFGCARFGLRSAMMVVLALVLVAAIVARAVAKPQSEPVMENS